MVKFRILKKMDTVVVVKNLETGKEEPLIVDYLINLIELGKATLENGFVRTVNDKKQLVQKEMKNQVEDFSAGGMGGHGFIPKNVVVEHTCTCGGKCYHPCDTKVFYVVYDVEKERTGMGTYTTQVKRETMFKEENIQNAIKAWRKKASNRILRKTVKFLSEMPYVEVHTCFGERVMDYKDVDGEMKVVTLLKFSEDKITIPIVK